MKNKAQNKQLHIVIQGKGGCGKSLIALILGMYFKFHCKKSASLFDIDQVNTTLSQYRNLNAEHLRITDKDNINEINPRLIDELIQKIIDSDSEVVLVDTGSNTFLNLLNYLVQNQIFDILYSMDISVFIHTVIVGSGDYNDTLAGAKAIIENLSVPVIIWVNEFWGPAIEKLQSSVLNHPEYEHKEIIKAYILLPALNQKLQGEDLRIMISERLTLPEIDKSEKFGMIPRIRLKKLFVDYFEKIDAVGFYEEN
jgi:hypothetical protein